MSQYSAAWLAVRALEQAGVRWTFGIPGVHNTEGYDELDKSTLAAFRVSSHAQVMATNFEAARIALSRTPGPVLVELPVNLQIIPGEAGELPDYLPNLAPPLPDSALIEQAANILNRSQRPVIFLGWGARNAGAAVQTLSDRLQAPVVTTLQGLASFPHESPSHVGFGFGPSAVASARHGGSLPALQSLPKVLIVGAGAIGASLAGWLAPHYAQLYITDVGDALTALKSTGITIYQTDQPAATRETVTVRVIDGPPDLPDADIVIIAVKNYHLPAVAEQLAQVYGPDRLIVSLANGTDNQQILSRRFKRVIYGVIGYNAKYDADVVVGYQKKGPLLLGTPGNTLQHELHQVQSILNLACPTDIVDRLDDTVHTKLVMNLTNALDSLVGHGVVPLSDFSAYQRLLVNTLWEGARIVQAAGYREYRIKGLPSFFLLRLGTIMPAWIADPIFKRKMKAMVVSSMTQDVLLRGAQATELESLTGYIVRLAAASHTPAPYNQTIYRLGREKFHPGFKPMRCEDVLAEVKKAQATAP